MTLILSNDDVEKLLTMPDTIGALEDAYKELADGRGITRTRSDCITPTSHAPDAVYGLKSMDGVVPALGVGAIRINSDIITNPVVGNTQRRVKVPAAPGNRYVGLVLLFSTANGEPLAIFPDGVVQHMRVGATNGIGVKYMARKNAEVVGMLGSGGMARDHMKSFRAVRNIKKLQVYSPTKANCEAFAAEMAAKYNMEVQVCERPEDVYKGAHIVAALTDSAVPVLNGDLIEPGAHVVNIGGSGVPDRKTMDRVDVYLRFGDAPAPVGRPELALDDEYIAWEARPDLRKYGDGRSGKKGHGAAEIPGRRVSLKELMEGTAEGRTSDDEITWSERGNLQGAQFYAVAGRVFELARDAGLGYEVPTDLFLQDIRN